MYNDLPSCFHLNRKIDRTRNGYIMGGGDIGKIMVLTFNDKEEKAVKGIITALADSIQLETMQPRPFPCYPFRDWK